MRILDALEISSSSQPARGTTQGLHRVSPLTDESRSPDVARPGNPWPLSRRRLSLVVIGGLYSCETLYIQNFQTRLEIW